MRLKHYLIIVIFSFCCNSITTAQSHSRQKWIKTDKFVPLLVINDSAFLQQIDSLVFNSIYSNVIGDDKIKIFNVQCIKKKDDYAIDMYMLCSLFFLSDLALQGCFEYRDYLFLWYGDLPDIWKSSKYIKKLTYLRGDPFSPLGSAIHCDLASFSFDYVGGELVLTKWSCY
jgi:hypothetical protein